MDIRRSSKQARSEGKCVVTCTQKMEVPDHRNTPLVDVNTSAAGAIDRLVVFSDDVWSVLMMAAIDETNARGDVLFGETQLAVLLGRRVLTPCRFAREPWAVGSFPSTPSPVATMAIDHWMGVASSTTLAS